MSDRRSYTVEEGRVLVLIHIHLIPVCNSVYVSICRGPIVDVTCLTSSASVHVLTDKATLLWNIGKDWLY